MTLLGSNAEKARQADVIGKKYTELKATVIKTMTGSVNSLNTNTEASRGQQISALHQRMH